jgi:hypothetical protein
MVAQVTTFRLDCKPGNRSQFPGDFRDVTEVLIEVIVQVLRNFLASLRMLNSGLTLALGEISTFANELMLRSGCLTNTLSPATIVEITGDRDVTRRCIIAYDPQAQLRLSSFTAIYYSLTQRSQDYNTRSRSYNSLRYRSQAKQSPPP